MREIQITAGHPKTVGRPKTVGHPKTVGKTHPEDVVGIPTEWSQDR